MPNALTLADMSPGLLEVVEKHESHQRKSRMVEISLSGSGEGLGWATAQPTLQRPFPLTASVPSCPPAALPLVRSPRACPYPPAPPDAPQPRAGRSETLPRWARGGEKQARYETDATLWHTRRRFSAKEWEHEG